MLAGEEALGSLRGRPELKAELRAGFWEELRGGLVAGGVDNASRAWGPAGRIV